MGGGRGGGGVRVGIRGRRIRTRGTGREKKEVKEGWGIGKKGG